jgi:hypothetical protein
MNDNEFEQWKSRLWFFGPYGNPDDYDDEFKKLLEEADHTDRRVLVELLKTFTNEDDYGLQESVFHVLEKFDPDMFAECLVEQFPDLQVRSSEKEWPLLIIGGYVNSEDDVMLRLFVEYSEKSANRDDPLSMYNFMRSEYFLYDYPEMLPYMNHENDHDDYSPDI